MRSRALSLSVAGLAVLGTSLVGAAPTPAAGPCSSPTVTGTGSDDRLRGTAGPDVVAGLGGDDVLVGLGGDDVLCGGPGQDVLRGGPGADRLLGGTDAKVAEDTDYYEYYGDELDGGPGSDTLDGGLDARHDGSVDRLTFAGLPGPVVLDLQAGTATSGADTDTVTGPVSGVLGTDHDDVLIGSDADESIDGGRGSDQVEGRGGDDWLDGGTQGWDDESGDGDELPNTLLGGPGDDVVDGDAGPDLLRGGGGNDLLQGNEGVDRAYGGSGSDGINDETSPAPGTVLDGGAGRGDYLAGVALVDGRGRFRGHVTGRIDMAAGTLAARIGSTAWSVAVPGFEEVPTPRGDLWTVLGTDGRDKIYAGFFSDPVRIHARGGDDSIFGSDQDDLLDGGTGDDHGSGWGGQDRYVSVERIRDR